MTIALVVSFLIFAPACRAANSVPGGKPAVNATGPVKAAPPAPQNPAHGVQNPPPGMGSATNIRPDNLTPQNIPAHESQGTRILGDGTIPQKDIPAPSPEQLLPRNEPTPVRDMVGGLEDAAAKGKLPQELPNFYDRSQGPTQDSLPYEEARWEDEGGPPPRPSGLRPSRASGTRGPEETRAEYEDFLLRIGFRDYPARIGEALKRQDLAPLQKKVLEFNAKRYRVLDSARDYAADVMAGLSEQEFSEDSLERATELAARLLSLQPLDSPSSLPAEIAKKDKEGIIQWMVAVTVQKLGGQLAQMVSDTVKTAVHPQVLARRIESLRQKEYETPETKAFLARVAAVKARLETQLVTMYTDAEIGQTRYAGRALAASLARYARLRNKPELLEKLKEKLLQRDLHLENFVGDTLVLSDDSSRRPKRLKIETGDFLGERSAGHEAAEITFAVRPDLRLWFKAWRQKLLGSPVALWANPKSSPRLVPGQGLLNRLKLAWRGFRLWVAELKIFRRGYSHVGMAWVEEADGVSMAWAVDNYPNAGEGGIRKIGIAEQFAQSGPFLRLGIARLDPDKVWQAFREQALQGWKPTVYDSKNGKWPAAISPKDHAALAQIPRGESSRLLREINERAVRALEQMLMRWGVAFGYGFTNEIWSAYCSSTMMLAHRMGSQFEVQAYRDHWHPLVLLLKKLGLAAKDQDTQSRIIWPGSLFIDPKVSRHMRDNYPPFTEVGRLPDPYSIPAYVEMDRELTKGLTALLQMNGQAEGGIHPDEDLIDYALRSHLDARADKGRAKRGWSSGSSQTGGYSSGLEELLSEEEY